MLLGVRLVLLVLDNDVRSLHPSLNIRSVMCLVLDRVGMLLAGWLDIRYVVYVLDCIDLVAIRISTLQGF